MKPEGTFNDSITSSILDSISDGAFTVEHDWQITSFSRAAEEIFVSLKMRLSMPLSSVVKDFSYRNIFPPL
jgi:hypothetical protein